MCFNFVRIICYVELVREESFFFLWMVVLSYVINKGNVYRKLRNIFLIENLFNVKKRSERRGYMRVFCIGVELSFLCK